MLVQVVQQGTAQDAAGLSGGAGGKTGTAQTGQFTPCLLYTSIHLLWYLMSQQKIMRCLQFFVMAHT